MAHSKKRSRNVFADLKRGRCDDLFTELRNPERYRQRLEIEDELINARAREEKLTKEYQSCLDIEHNEKAKLNTELEQQRSENEHLRNMLDSSVLRKNGEALEALLENRQALLRALEVLEKLD